MPDAPIQLVCFDLGGVLVRLADGWLDACRRAGVPLPPQAEAGGDFWAGHHAVSVRYETGLLDDAGYLAEAGRCWPCFSREEIAAAFDAYIQGLYDGVESLLDDIHSAGVRTACLSNTSHRHWVRFTGADPVYAPLLKLHVPCASHLIGAMKPDSRTYTAVERHGGTPPASILFFDDRPENIDAAVQRGWRGEVIDPRGDTVRQMRTHLSRHGVIRD